MSANESTPAVSLREARSRELVECSWMFTTEANRRSANAARRATDEALLAAFLEWFGRVPFSRLERLGLHGEERAPNWSAVLDAVEREEAGR